MNMVCLNEWGDMFQGGDGALQASCGEFDSHSLHQFWKCFAMKKKKYIRALTESGDYYSATKELWDEYHDAVHRNDWDHVLWMEEGWYKDFFYDP